jgi:hypothetical protein
MYIYSNSGHGGCHSNSGQGVVNNISGRGRATTAKLLN